MPGWGTEIPQTQWFDQKKEDGEYCSMFIFWNEQSNRGRNYWSNVLGLLRWNENSYKRLLFIGIWVDLLIQWKGWEILFWIILFSWWSNKQVIHGEGKGVQIAVWGGVWNKFLGEWKSKRTREMLSNYWAMLSPLKSVVSDLKWD